MTPEERQLLTDLAEGLAVWRDGLGLKVEKYVEMPEKGLQIAFLPCGETMIELLAPLGSRVWPLTGAGGSEE